MIPDWLARLILVALLAGLGWLVYLLVRRGSLAIAAKRQTVTANSTARHTIVYFTTPDCLACKAAQRPALAQLKAALGDDLEIVEIDAYEKPEVARSWGVMSVPTTFVLNAAGTPRQVNYGVAPYRKLLEQLGGVS